VIQKLARQPVQLATLQSQVQSDHDTYLDTITDLINTVLSDPRSAYLLANGGSVMVADSTNSWYWEAYSAEVVANFTDFTVTPVDGSSVPVYLFSAPAQVAQPPVLGGGGATTTP